MAKDKNAPKRPSTSYMVYTSMIREELRNETGLSGIALAPFFAKRWAELEEAKKEKLSAKYQKAMVGWRKKNDKYKKTAAYKEFKAAQKLKKWKKAPKDTNAPKRSSSAYFLYANAVRDEVKQALGDAAVTEIAKKIGEQWSNLEETTKSKYVSKAEKAKAQYQKKLAKYKTSRNYAKYYEIKKAFLAEKKAAIKAMKQEAKDGKKAGKNVINKKKK
jgi:hypothetical protein